MKLFNYFWLKFVKVDIENPIALHFIMQDDLFFLEGDKNAYKKADVAVAEPIKEAITIEPILETKAVEFNFTGTKNTSARNSPGFYSRIE